MQVEVKLLLLFHDRKPFGICLHHAVFDAVVDHFHEVSRSRRTHVAPAHTRSESQYLENRPEMVHRFRLTADHHAVTFLQPPDAAARAHVDHPDAHLFQNLRPHHRLTVARVTAVDHDVTLIELFCHADHGVACHPPGGKHKPHGPRRLELRHHIQHRLHDLRTVIRQGLPHLLIAVVTHHPVPGTHQPPCNITAHLAKPNDCDIHLSPLLVANCPLRVACCDLLVA